MMTRNLNRRFSPNRRKTRVEATIDMDGARVPAFIRDVSFEGMKLDVPIQIEKGTPVTIEVFDQSIPAIVHWCGDGQMGVHLLQRLEGQTLLALENAEDDLAEFR